MEVEVRNILTDVFLRATKPVADLQRTVDRLYQGKKSGNKK